MEIAATQVSECKITESAQLSERDLLFSHSLLCYTWDVANTYKIVLCTLPYPCPNNEMNENN